ncbi:MAG: hypothetical protein V1847_03725 [Candidatus Diapherotrites archaeon]
MKLAPWKVFLNPGWEIHFKHFDVSVQAIISKKLEQLQNPLRSRGLQHSRYLVEEVGQYRIAFIQDEKERIRTVYFVGNHKQYEKWFSELEE